MPNYLPVTELITKIEAADKIAEKSELTRILAQALIGNLRMFDLKNIIDPRFMSNEHIHENIDYAVKLFKSPQELTKLMAAFTTTLYVVPMKAGYSYKFELTNDHRFYEVETFLIANGNFRNVIIPLHNLFLQLDGKPLVYPDPNDHKTEGELAAHTLFPYFEILRLDDHHDHDEKCIRFKRLDLLEKLNGIMAARDFHLGNIMFSFLNKGKHSKAFSEKVFNSYKQKYRLKD